MKIIKAFILALIITGSVHCVSAQGIPFEQSSWATILQKAKTSNKNIFVYFYVTGCEVCNRIINEVFTDTEVGSYFGKHFISYKVDALKEEKNLVNSAELQAHPTCVVFNPNGDIVYKYIGLMDTYGFLGLGKKVVNFKINQKKTLSDQASKREILDYLSIAKFTDPENYKRIAEKIAKEFTTDDLTDPDAWDVLITNVRDFKHPAFQRAIDGAGVLSKIHHNYVDYITLVLDHFFSFAVYHADDHNVSFDLFTYKNSFKRFYRNLGMDYDDEYFNLVIEQDFHYRLQNWLEYAKIATTWVENYLMNDWKELSETAQHFCYIIDSEMSEKHKEEANHYKKKALQWARHAADIDRNKLTLFNLAKVYECNGRKMDALRCAKEVLEFDLAEEETQLVKEYIEELGMD